MNETIKCIAVHGVTTDRLYLPGETLELSPEDVDMLEADGAVERVLDSEVTLEPHRPVTLVKGIGPKTAERLVEFGVGTLEDLSKVPIPDGPERLGEALDVKPDVVRAWIDQSLALLEAERTGD